MRYVRIAAWFVLASLFPLAAMAGSIDSPGTPPSAGSGMYTLQGLYDYLLSGTAASISTTFQEPTAGQGDTGKTINDTHDEIKAEFDACDVTADKVLDTVTFFSTDTANWGPISGTLAMQTLSDAVTTVAAGYYSATTLDAVDMDLVSANIKAASTIFGVAGKTEVVDTTETANPASASDVVMGGVAYVNGNKVTGTGPYPAPVARTGQTTSYASGDDGALQKGVAWPTPRFTVGGDNDGDGNCTDTDETCDGTVTDNLTGLIWLRDADCPVTVDGSTGRAWADALTFANDLADGSCDLADGSVAGDWRLPNLSELKSLLSLNYYNPAISNECNLIQFFLKIIIKPHEYYVHAAFFVFESL